LLKKIKDYQNAAKIFLIEISLPELTHKMKKSTPSPPLKTWNI